MLLITIDIVLDRLLIRDVIKAILSSIFFHRLFGSIRPLSPPREVLEITYPSVDDPALDALLDEKLTRLTAALDTSSQYIANQPYAGSTQHQRVPYPAPSDSFTYIPNSFGGGSDQSDLGGDFAKATSTAIASVASPSFASSVGTGSQLHQQPPQDSTSFVIPAPSLASLNLSSINSVKKAQIVVNFFEKKTRKAWFSKSEEEVCWEEWIINISSITPRNESEKIRVAKSAENQLQMIIMKIIDIVNDNKDHIPPIATTEANPFPYQISIPSETEDTWGSVFKKILVE